MKEVSKSVLKQIYTKRNPWSHKGDYGKLLIVSGSEKYSGSPILEGLVAYRSGCDIVTVASPTNAAQAIKSYSPDLITIPLKGEYLEARHEKEIMGLEKKATAMLIGGGLTRTEDVLSAVKVLIKESTLPKVIDADALYAINGQLHKNCILTPHSTEFKVLSGVLPSKGIKQRIHQTEALARRLHCTILLKGHIDVVSDGKRTAINKTGNAFMTKAGMGDTLAGICGGVLARGIEPFEAACAAAYINGKAGDLAAKVYGEALLASDILNYIAQAIKI